MVEAAPNTPMCLFLKHFLSTDTVICSSACVSQQKEDYLIQQLTLIIFLIG